MKKSLSGLFALFCGCLLFCSCGKPDEGESAEDRELEAIITLVEEHLNRALFEHLSGGLGDHGHSLSDDTFRKYTEWELTAVKDLSSKLDGDSGMKKIEYRFRFRFTDELLFYWYGIEKDPRGWGHRGYIGLYSDKLPDDPEEFHLEDENNLLREDHKPFFDFWKDYIIYEPAKGADQIFYGAGKVSLSKGFEGWESGTYQINTGEVFSGLRHQPYTLNHKPDGKVFRSDLQNQFSGKKILLKGCDEHRKLEQEYDRKFAAARAKFLKYCDDYETARKAASETYHAILEQNRAKNGAYHKQGTAKTNLIAAERKAEVARAEVTRKKKMLDDILIKQKKNRIPAINRAEAELKKAKNNAAETEAILQKAKTDYAAAAKEYQKQLNLFNEAEQAEKEAKNTFSSMVPPWRK